VIRRRAHAGTASTSGHESAADRAAARALGSSDGFAHRAPIAAAPRAGLGPGAPLPEPTRAHFEHRLGADLSAVRVHTDANAGRAARAEGAAAFAFGSDVVFAPGRYAPETAAGKRLLAHELAHVVQQGGGAPALGLGAAPYGIQRAVETLGGEWSTDPNSYALTHDDWGHRGCTIDLRFTPGEAVDATKIGLVQSVASVRNGAPFAITETAGARMVPAGGTGAGRQIDRKPEFRNPIYGMADPKDGAGGLGASESEGSSQWGWRYEEGFFGVTWITDQDATLHDAPGFAHGPNSGQTFETTALAVEGAQAGTFYGSVRWGWTSDAANVPSLLPLGVVSVGVPTAGFRRAGEVWNRTPTVEGARPLPLPQAAGSANRKLPREMTTTELVARIEAIDREMAEAMVINQLGGLAGPATTLETLTFERRALRAELRTRPGDFPTGPRPASVPT
jgi:hypothetical protein